MGALASEPQAIKAWVAAFRAGSRGVFQLNTWVPGGAPLRDAEHEQRLREFLARNLKVADSTAVSLCMDNGLPILVFDLRCDGNIGRAVRGEKIGTLITSDA